MHHRKGGSPIMDEEQKITESSNAEAWKDKSYDAWVLKYGPAPAVAKRIRQNPARTLGVLREVLGDPQGRKMANLMGSHGMKAVAVACLGAQATVFDFSEGNRRYALELAEAAGVSLRYVLADVVRLPQKELTGDYDVVLAEMGILHYFSDLSPFMATVRELLSPGGHFILRDFHPVTTKLISSKGSTAKVRKHKVDGDYFDTSLTQTPVSFAKYLQDDTAKPVLLRKWTLGEVVTAVAQAGLHVEMLLEEPNLSGEAFDKGIPKTFTLVARKL